MDLRSRGARNGRAAAATAALLLPMLFVVLVAFSGCATASYQDPDSLRNLVERGDTPYTLVDVRTPAEYSSGYIPTAVNIPVSEIASNLPKAPKDSLVIVYCASGGRSARAAAALQAAGFTRVVDFGGIFRWKGPLAKGN